MIIDMMERKKDLQGLAALARAQADMIQMFLAERDKLAILDIDLTNARMVDAPNGDAPWVAVGEHKLLIIHRAEKLFPHKVIGRLNQEL